MSIRVGSQKFLILSTICWLMPKCRIYCEGIPSIFTIRLCKRLEGTTSPQHNLATHQAMPPVKVCRSFCATIFADKSLDLSGAMTACCRLQRIYHERPMGSWLETTPSCDKYRGRKAFTWCDVDRGALPLLYRRIEFEIWVWELTRYNDASRSVTSDSSRSLEVWSSTMTFVFSVQ